MPIQLLAPDVAAKIAAGEVVERPANVVKELMENSLDAGATEVRVEIREGGQRLLRVTDNGHGIPAAEVPLAFARHATSKLTSADDLYHIMSYGFRGEALYSIAAVSHTTLTTRHRDESFGSQLQLEGGNIVSQGRAGTPVGTVLNVEHLFYNVPARKKFLRQPATETGQIAEVIKRYALAFPDRRFSLVVDGRLTFQSSGSGDLYDVLVKVFGLENARQFVPIGAPRRRDDEAAENGVDEDVDFMELAAPPRIASPVIHSTSSSLSSAPTEPTVLGYTSLPSLTRANRNSIDIFINHRYVEDRTLTHAVVQAYHTLLPVGRYPLALIFLEIDPSTVDVNVHPQKTQVRLVEERRLFNVVQRAVRRALVHNAPIPDMDLPAPLPPTADAWSPSLDPGWAARRDAILNAGNLNAGNNQPELDFYVPQPPPPGLPQQPSDGAIWSPPPNAQPLPPPPAQPASGPARQPTITPHSAQLPPLRVVGQVGALYIIAEGPEGVYLIDQHAAHERILYEQFMAARYGQGNDSENGYVGGQSGVAQQHLLEPLTLHIGHELTGLVAHHLDELQTVGFSVEPFGGDTFLVRAVPAVLSGQDPLRALEEIVTSLAQQRNQVGEELEARLVKMICKRAAIKAGQLLSPLEMQELVRQLEACQSPRTCPHGRPTMIQLSAGELEKAFGRI